jgi:hypothetical protein
MDWWSSCELSARSHSVLLPKANKTLLAHKLEMRPIHDKNVVVESLYSPLTSLAWTGNNTSTTHVPCSHLSTGPLPPPPDSHGEGATARVEKGGQAAAEGERGRAADVWKLCELDAAHGACAGMQVRDLLMHAKRMQQVTSI